MKSENCMSIYGNCQIVYRNFRTRTIKGKGNPRTLFLARLIDETDDVPVDIFSIDTRMKYIYDPVYVSPNPPLHPRSTF